MSRTLIRGAQIHPDISGVIMKYTKDVYPEYRTYSGASGIDIVSGEGRVGIVSAGKILSSGIVHSLGNLKGNIGITGVSGINIKSSGNNFVLYYEGGTVQSVNGIGGFVNITGLGNTVITTQSPSTIRVSGKNIQTLGGVTMFETGGSLNIDGRRLVYTLNGGSGDLNLQGRNGIDISRTGLNVYIDGYAAANSGVMTLNGIKGTVSISGIEGLEARGIRTTYDPIYRTINIQNTSVGWGNDNSQANCVNPVFIGNNNNFIDSNDITAKGEFNVVERSTGSCMLNSRDSFFVGANNSTFINSSGVNVENINGATLINGVGTNLLYPYSFSVGNSSYNSAYSIINMRAATATGRGPIKYMTIPRTQYSGIEIGTGCVLFGQMDYVFLRSNITDFWANFNPLTNGTYGRKYFILQRNLYSTVNILDQADLFGGSDQYNVSMSGGNDGKLYIYASGISGESYISQASIQFSNMSFEDFEYNKELY